MDKIPLSSEGPSGCPKILRLVPHALPDGMLSIEITARGYSENTRTEVDVPFSLSLSAEEAKLFGGELAAKGHQSQQDLNEKSRTGRKGPPRKRQDR
jgi:hypothetical protein